MLPIRIERNGVAKSSAARLFQESSKRNAFSPIGFVSKKDATSFLGRFARSVCGTIVTDEHRRGMFERSLNDAADGACMIVRRDYHARAGLIAAELGVGVAHLWSCLMSSLVVNIRRATSR